MFLFLCCVIILSPFILVCFPLSDCSVSIVSLLLASAQPFDDFKFLSVCLPFSCSICLSFFHRWFSCIHLSMLSPALLFLTLKGKNTRRTTLKSSEMAKEKSLFGVSITQSRGQKTKTHRHTHTHTHTPVRAHKEA